MEPRDGLTVLIPARGGSKQIPDKNLRLVAGIPLVIHIARIAGQVGHPIVSTDSPRIQAVCDMHNVDWIHRPERLADDVATVDEVVAWHLNNHHVDYPLLVVQPTVPEITAKQLSQFMDWTDAAEHRASTIGIPNTHIMWDGVSQPERVNRQDMNPTWQEIGVRYYRHHPAEPPGTAYRLDRDLTDIDTPDDLLVARRRLERWDITFDYIASETLGWGHLGRCHTLAQELSSHVVGFGDLAPGTPPPSGKGVWLFDRLDTSAEQVADATASGWKTVTLEDRGPGARIADATINALYPLGGLPHERAGADWVVLKPDFHGLPENRYDAEMPEVLVTFGGTDFSRLTEWATKVLDDFNITVIQPPGRGGPGVPSMAYMLWRADIVVTSAGRTLYEAASVGTPAVSIAANNREQSHAHLNRGNLYMGHHATVSDDDLYAIVEALADSPELRRDIGEEGRRSIDGKGTARLVHLIEGLML